MKWLPISANMPQVSLIFDRNQVFLGEVMTRDGGLERVLLNGEGERHIGSYLADWQLRGIPVVREIMDGGAGKPEVFFQERVPVRTHEFWNALERWCGQHGMVLLQVPKDCIKTWEGLAHLPLEDSERFSMFVAMKGDTETALWSALVAEAVHATHTNDPSAKKKMLELRKKAAGGLMKKMATA